MRTAMACYSSPDVSGTEHDWPYYYQIEELKAVAQEVLAQYPGVPAIKAMLDFVSSHVTYAYDLAQFGAEEAFQLPTQLLQTWTGDCEDAAYLLASLLQALGFWTAYVYIGMVPGGWHAWVEVDCKDGNHYILESLNGMVYPESKRNMISYNAYYAITPDGCYAIS